MKAIKEKKVKITKTGATVCSLEDICFPVELIDNPNRTNREYSKIVVGVVGDSAIDLNYCSPIYELVPNESIFPKVEEILKKHNIKFTANYSHVNNARFYGDIIIDDPRFSYKIKGKDEIKFMWSFQHSYNGLTKYKGIAGYYRLICTNGLTVPVREMNEYNLSIGGKHTGSILHSLENFSNIIENVVLNLGDISTSITQQYEKLATISRINPIERVEKILKGTNITMVNNSKFSTLNEINNRILYEANLDELGYNGEVNDWLIYNSINAYINNNNRNIALPEKRRETDSKILEYMLEYK